MSSKVSCLDCTFYFFKCFGLIIYMKCLKPRIGIRVPGLLRSLTVLACMFQVYGKELRAYGLQPNGMLQKKKTGRGTEMVRVG